MLILQTQFVTSPLEFHQKCTEKTKQKEAWFSNQNTLMANNTISLSCHEQVCLSVLRFERYFSHHRAK